MKNKRELSAIEPLFSIITVTFNAVAVLERTIRSVAQQTFQNIEYLIVDGASTDGTLDMVRQFEGVITTWESAPDDGIYDAMNKGLRLAKGRYVLFLNAGDVLFSDTVLENLAQLASDEVDVLYGETMLQDLAGNNLGTRTDLTTRKLPPQLDWQSFRLGMTVSHQSFIARRAIAPAYLQHNLAADIDWCIRCLKKSRKVVHAHQIISGFLEGGFSKQHQRQSLIDRFQVMRTHYGLADTIWCHLQFILRIVGRND